MSEQRAQMFVDPADLPVWMQQLGHALPDADVTGIRRVPDEASTRRSSVLALFGETGGIPDVLILQRAAELRAHAGQPAFPGGQLDPEDRTPVDTALREAQEETRLDPSTVTVVATLPEIWVPPSGFVVTPVIGWWHEPMPVAVGDPAEVSAVFRVPIDELVDPVNRVVVTHPSGFTGPGFDTNGVMIWGFTALLLDRLLDLGGFTIPWQPGAREVSFDQLHEAVRSVPRTGEPT